jgi:hypothetical protein
MGTRALILREKQALSTSKSALEQSLAPGISHDRVTDLRRFYTISFAYTIQHSLWSFLVIFIAWSLYLIIFGFRDYELSLSSHFSVSSFLLLRIATLLPLFVVGYWELSRGAIELRIEGFRLIKITGLFLKFYDSRAICPITSVTVLQSNKDKLFGVYHVEFRAGPTPPKHGPLIIPALSEKDALAFEQYVSTQLSRLSSPSEDALREDQQQVDQDNEPLED